MNIPVEIELKLRKEFESHPKVIELTKGQGEAMRRGDYIKSLKLASTVGKMWNEVKESYIKSTMKDCEKISFANLGLPKEDMDEVSRRLITIFMAAEIMDFAVFEINEILRKTDKDFCFDMFEDFMLLNHELKDKMKFFDMNTSYNKDLFWPDKCDDMYDAMIKKAKQIIRKRHQKGWGDNFKIPEK